MYCPIVKLFIFVRKTKYKHLALLFKIFFIQYLHLKIAELSNKNL